MIATRRTIASSRALMGFVMVSVVLTCMGCSEGSSNRDSESSQFEREVASLVESLKSDYGPKSATPTTAAFSADDVEDAVSRIAGKANSDDSRPPGYVYWSSGRITVSAASGTVDVKQIYNTPTSVYQGTISDYASFIQGTTYLSQYRVSEDMTTTSSFHLTGETHADYDGDHQFTLVVSGSGSSFKELPANVIADGSSLSTTRGYLDGLIEAVEKDGTMPTDTVQALYVIWGNLYPYMAGYGRTGAYYEKEVYTDCETDIGTVTGTRASVTSTDSSENVFSFSVSGDSGKYLWIHDGNACKLYRDGLVVVED